MFPVQQVSVAVIVLPITTLTLLKDNDTNDNIINNRNYTIVLISAYFPLQSLAAVPCLLLGLLFRQSAVPPSGLDPWSFTENILTPEHGQYNK